jgi:hypothetical protein
MRDLGAARVYCVPCRFNTEPVPRKKGSGLSALSADSGEPRWQTASFCEGGACVGVARDGEQVLVRNTSTPGAREASFTRDEWKAFVAGVKNGEFDHFFS